jgi:hypothetical protein
LAAIAATGVAGPGTQPHFSSQIDLGALEYSGIKEASGMAASRRNPDVFWTHNDSGDANRIYAFNGRGRHLGVYTIDGASARDWEDICAGPGPQAGVSYLYIGNIGDNAAGAQIKYIYRIPEPAVSASQAPVNVTLTGAATISYQYPDGPRDAETLMLDPQTRDLYVVSKREAQVRVYRAPYPQSLTSVNTLQYACTLGFDWAVGGDISPDGSEILIKKYSKMYYWRRLPGQTIAEALSEAPLSPPYVPEVKSEAVAWRADGGGYYSVSEGAAPRLNYYQRLAPENDFDGDGRSDITVLSRTSSTWYLLPGRSPYQEIVWGERGTVAVPGDYDGDQVIDIAVYAPGTGDWSIRLSSGGTRERQFGYPGVRPVPGDYDGDAKTDLAVYDPLPGQFRWHLLQSRAGYSNFVLGSAGAWLVPADYDGDGRCDPAVYDPATSTWTLKQSTAGLRTKAFGFGGVEPVPGDYDADFKADLAVYDANSVDGRWYLSQSTAGYEVRPFGFRGAELVPGDYDGDGRTDLGVYDPVNYKWYIQMSGGGYRVQTFGYLTVDPVTAPR